MSERDPYTEAENSTVDNWLGQEVSEDQELADRLADETGGDDKEAERRFRKESAGAEPDPGEVRRADGDGFA